MAARTKEQTARYEATRKVKREKERADRKSQGLCILCGDPIDPGRIFCRRCLDKKIIANQTWKAKHPGKANQFAYEYRQRLKRTIMDAYGGVCTCCGESSLIFLCIDHVNNDGAAHRKETFGKSNGCGGNEFYMWLRNNEYPDGFQVLCFNCNSAKQFNGYCPHWDVPQAA